MSSFGLMRHLPSSASFLAPKNLRACAWFTAALLAVFAGSGVTSAGAGATLDGKRLAASITKLLPKLLPGDVRATAPGLFDVKLRQ